MVAMPASYVLVPSADAFAVCHAEQDHVYDAHAAQSRPWPAGLSHALRAHGELAEAGRPLDWRQADCLMSELLWGKHMLNPKAFPDRNLGTTEAELSRQVGSHTCIVQHSYACNLVHAAISRYYGYAICWMRIILQLPSLLHWQETLRTY